MSTQGSHVPRAPSADDGVNMKLILTVGAASLATFAASAIVAFVILERDTNRLRAARGEPQAAPGIGKPEIGIVDQVHFDDDRRLEVWRAARRRHLQSYGWVDRQRGLIHIPVAEAMKDVIAQAAAAPAVPANPPGGTPSPSAPDGTPGGGLVPAAAPSTAPPAPAGATPPGTPPAPAVEARRP